MNTQEAKDALVAGAEVTARYGHNDVPFARGRVVAVADHPMVLIRDEDGNDLWWAAHLTDRAEADR